MKAVMLFTGSGPVVILTSHDSVTDPALLEKLKAKGIERFLAYYLPLDVAKKRYGGHFQTVLSRSLRAGAGGGSQSKLLSESKLPSRR